MRGGETLVKLYSTGCPRCNVLEIKLEQANIDYVKSNDTEYLVANGINAVPVLDVDGELLDFMEAIEWIKNNEVG